MNCWLNGALLDVEQARIDPRDRGFLLGDGIFETLLAENGALRHARRHLARLHAAARLLAITMPYPDAEIIAALASLLDKDRIALRITLTRGTSGRGLAPPENPRPSLLITAAAAPPPPQAMRAVITSQIRNEKSLTSQIKSLNYLDNVMARREAMLRGADEAVLCNTAGRIACASAANIFIVRDNIILTPALGEGALAGIVRGIVIQAASGLNIPQHQTRLERADVLAADEIFLTNALIGVCPVLSLEGRAFAPGPVTAILRDATALIGDEINP